MVDRARRKELRERYRQNRPEAGVYAIRNVRTGRLLLGSSPNLPSVANKLDFARSTGLEGALDRRLGGDVRAYGLDAFALEVLEVLDVSPTATPREVLDDLGTLEELWREKLAGSSFY